MGNVDLRINIYSLTLKATFYTRIQKNLLIITQNMTKFCSLIRIIIGIVINYEEQLFNQLSIYYKIIDKGIRLILGCANWPPFANLA